MKQKICKFAFAVFALELAAGVESFLHRNYKMAAVWGLYSLSNLVLAFIEE